MSYLWSIYNYVSSLFILDEEYYPPVSEEDLILGLFNEEPQEPLEPLKPQDETV